VARRFVVMQKLLFLPFVALLSAHCITQLQKIHVELDNNILFRRYELTVHQIVNVKEFRELFDCFSFKG
jgi:hypothetical protein